CVPSSCGFRGSLSSSAQLPDALGGFIAPPEVTAILGAASKSGESTDGTERSSAQEGLTEPFDGILSELGDEMHLKMRVAEEPWCRYDHAQLSQTYVALCSLLILGDDLQKVDRKSVFSGLKALQMPDGSFCSHLESESDMRFVYCAMAVCYILNDFSAIDLQRSLNFIRKSFCYDGGFGQRPLLESHGGSTYCAVACLALSGHLWDGSVLNAKQIERLKRWCVLKQNDGFHGRANKPDDSCYAFWVGATLKMLDAYSLIDRDALRSFLLSVQDQRIGGFCKFEDSNYSEYFVL
ncbi:unnamed protein product, partial [Anisakis simplex]|uniref:Geranylgeranyl transferase type-1 subunit beta (inferred by orthology to a human protein) n=1 Tax=Anisakis simplex TaxID=6269 RepID=A0A0M3J2W7_ANISI